MMKALRVLIGCEESGKVRDAFIKLGHDAISNDIVDARNGGPHLKKCVKKAIVEDGPWDIIILHYTCTEMAICANRWYSKGKAGWPQRQAAWVWSKDLWELAKRKKWERVWRMAKSPTRKRDRSETYQGIADAMAEQWGNL